MTYSVSIHQPGKADIRWSFAVYSPGQSLVSVAYQDFLGRSPTADELAVTSEQLDHFTLLPVQFLAALTSTTEWTSSIIDKLYLDTLARPGDPTGIMYWTNQIRSRSRTVADVAANFYASAEYYIGIGQGSDRSWLSDLYRKLLNRDPDPGGLDYWIAETPESRTGRRRAPLLPIGRIGTCARRKPVPRAAGTRRRPKGCRLLVGTGRRRRRPVLGLQSRCQQRVLRPGPGPDSMRLRRSSGSSVTVIENPRPSTLRHCVAADSRADRQPREPRRVRSATRSPLMAGRADASAQGSAELGDQGP